MATVCAQADGWEVLSHPSSCQWHGPTLEDDASSVISVTESNNSGWPALAPRPTAATLEVQRNYLSALIQGGGGLDGNQAQKMRRACRQERTEFVTRFHFYDEEDESSDDTPDVDEEWWLQKGHGATMARLRWRLDRRPVAIALPEQAATTRAKAGKQPQVPHRIPQRRRLEMAAPRLEPLPEYECGASAMGYQQGYRFSYSCAPHASRTEESFEW